MLACGSLIKTSLSLYVLEKDFISKMNYSLSRTIGQAYAIRERVVVMCSYAYSLGRKGSINKQYVE